MPMQQGQPPTAYPDDLTEGAGNAMTIHIVPEGRECQHACAQLNRSLASRQRPNALTAREPQQADDRVETTCRPTGRCLHLLSHRRNRPPGCSMRRKLVVPCSEIPRESRMSSPRSQERSTRSGQRGETAAWLGGSLSHCWTLSRVSADAPHHDGAVTSLVASAGHPTRCLISWALTLPPCIARQPRSS